jgi:flagellar hook assembly protein FlgD
MEAIAALTPGASTAAPLPIGEPPPNTSLDKDAFLKLLVAQLKYQDPTAPTDVSQMMAQTSQLSMVERLDEIAAGIDRLGGGAPLTAAASMLGRDVTFDAGTFEPITATVDAVRLVDGEVVLSAGGYDVPLTALLEVKNAVAVPVATPVAYADVHDHSH